IALRAALGAGRGRVLRQLLTESLVLGLAGAILGAALSTVAFTFLARLIPDNFPQGTTLALDPVVLLFAATVGVLTSVAFGLGPSLAASRFNLNDALKQSKMFGPGGRRRKIRSALVVVEVSMSAVLLVAATLLLRSYHQLSSVELGLSTEGLWIIETPLSTSRYRDSQRRSELASGVIERIGALSGVVSAGYVNYAPLVFKGGRAGFLIEGRPMLAPNQFPQQIVSDRVVSPGYFSTIGVPVLSGRPFEERDGPASVPGVLINQTMARMFWGDENPLGQRIRLSGSNTARWLTIIGVVGDMRQMGLELVPQPEMYLSFNQLPAEVPPFFWPRYLAVRTEGVDPIKLAAQVRHAVASIDP